MCQRIQQTWDCGCTYAEDPRKCRLATTRKKNCANYGIEWAFRKPIDERHFGDCLGCREKRMLEARRRADEDFIRSSLVYPHLRSLQARDDDMREMTGKPRFDRSLSSSSIVVPVGWSSALNRKPCNANEYEQYLRGQFDPLVELPDTHIPCREDGSVVDSANRTVETTQMHCHASPRAAPPAAAEGPTTTTTTAPPQRGYRSRAPPLGFAPQHSRPNPPISLARQFQPHQQQQRPRTTNPDDPTSTAAIILEDADYPYIPFHGRSTGAALNPITLSITNANSNSTNTNTAPQISRSLPNPNRRPSYSGCKEDKGWRPPSVGPLPPRAQTETAPPSRAGSPSWRKGSGAWLLECGGVGAGEAMPLFGVGGGVRGTEQRCC